MMSEGQDFIVSRHIISPTVNSIYSSCNVPISTAMKQDPTSSGITSYKVQIHYRTPMSSKQEGPRIQDICDTTGWLIMLMMIPVKRIAVPYGMGVLQRMQGLQFWSAA